MGTPTARSGEARTPKTPPGEGRADVTGALGFLAEALGGAPALPAVAGYSFGSAVGATVAAHDPRVRVYLGIAPPLNRYDLAVLRQARCRIAFIAGRHDELCDPARLEALAWVGRGAGD